MSSSKWIKNANRVWGSKQIVAGFIKVTVECTYFSGIIQNETNEKKTDIHTIQLPNIINKLHNRDF